VVIEDTLSGVQAGVAAGMRVFGYVADADGRGLQTAGAELFDSLEKLPGRLGLV
jgi:beta-phosphoglucomutase-like phosphatase (HAD superfamily)